MTDTLNIWWDNLEFGQQLFWSIAIFSSIIFSIQFMLSIIGMDSDADTDTSLSGESDFSIFSLRSIVAFFLFFGWTGVVMMQNGISLQSSILIAFVAGFLAMILVAYILFKLMNMGETGTIIIESAIGQKAEVYIPIPANLNGKGKVLIQLDSKTMELSAVTNGSELATKSNVIVVDILENNVLLVE